MTTDTRTAADRDEQGPLEAVVAAVKPHLRGWLHAGMVPLALAAGIVLIALAPTTPARIAATVFSVTAWLLFGTSAVYHRGNWSPTVAGVLKRMDHSNIFLIIAGTYTPFALLLPPRPGRADAAHRVDRRHRAACCSASSGSAHRAGSTRPIYVALGWVAVFYMGPLLQFGGPALVTLIAVGGLLYTVGALVYGIKRPNPSPRWFGFHEIFHTLTVAAFTVHYIAASMSVYGARHRRLS